MSRDIVKDKSLSLCDIYGLSIFRIDMRSRDMRSLDNVLMMKTFELISYSPAFWNYGMIYLNKGGAKSHVYNPIYIA